MATLATTSLEGRLLGAVEEQVSAEPVRQWDEGQVRLCLTMFQELNRIATGIRRMQEKEAAKGFEAGEFIRTHKAPLARMEDILSRIEKIRKLLATAKDQSSKKLAAEARAIDQQFRAIRDFLNEAMSLASAPAQPDWERIRAAEEAYARGEGKRLSS